MAKIKFDVSGVESGQDFDTPVPVGLYTAKVAGCEETESKSSGNPMLALTIEIAKGEYKGRNLWDYIVLNESSAWKMRQFLEAVKLIKDGKAKGTLDTKAVVGERLLVKVKHESDSEYGTRAKVGSLLAIPEDEAEEVEDDDPADAQVDEEEISLSELEDYEREDLEELIEERELEVRFTKKTKDSVLLERVIVALGLEEDEDEEEDEGYDSWSLPELKAELKERGLKSSGTKAALVNRLEADDEDEDGDEPF